VEEVLLLHHLEVVGLLLQLAVEVVVMPQRLPQVEVASCSLI
jgi:hypothetical protein